MTTFTNRYHNHSGLENNPCLKKTTPRFGLIRANYPSGTIEFFVENILNGAEFGDHVEFIATTTQALRQVSDNWGAIYYAYAPEVVPQCKIKALPIGRKLTDLVAPENCPSQRNQLNKAAFQSGDYPITRRLFVIVKQNGQIDQEVGEYYARLMLTDQGQDLIEKAGFVRIR